MKKIIMNRNIWYSAITRVFSQVTPEPATFSLISLQNSADRLQEIVNSSRVGETT